MNANDLEQKYKYVDPAVFGDDLKKHDQFLAVKFIAVHKAIEKMHPIHTNGLEKIDNAEWELFRSSHMVETQNGKIYYGMFVEGIGAFNVMVLEENARELTDHEKKEFSNKVYGMYSGLGGPLSYTMKLPEIK